uniref:CAP-Gly domain-containing protein n=1 Tax=Strombidinopsis acuminata TaxID=141414 RepID=A0A7S3U794_9SPIT|mmetsp:Transcript_90666/g.234105  ORF Transcript_90666/g.234105 Transcript_90666/m.234105 type:complete len:281 (-) Transcript_90666:64-906(-)
MIGTRAENLPSCHKNSDMMCLRDYVTGGDEMHYGKQAQGTLRLDVTHSNLLQRWHDIVFDDSMTVARVKDKLYRHGGTPAAFQELYLRRGGSDTIYLYDENKTLKTYGARSGMELHIKDTDEHSISKHGGLEDVSQVEKYEMEDEAYDKLDNSVRAIKRREKAKAEAERQAKIASGELEEIPEEDEAEVAANFPVGSRCEVGPGDRRGEVKYVGKVKGLKGVWIGVSLDLPEGMNDGSGKGGKQYFECKGDKYGCFAQSANVKVGDYPEVDPFASDDEEF